MTDADRYHIPPSAELERSVNAAYVLDLKPLVSWFRDELQRLRDQLAVERSATSSAREALAACEERLRSSEKFRLDTLAPGSTAAVIEAYRLIFGNAPHRRGEGDWVDSREHDFPNTAVVGEPLFRVAVALFDWLDEHAPGGKP